MLIHGTEIAEKLEVLEQISDLLANAQLTQAAQHAFRAATTKLGHAGGGCGEGPSCRSSLATRPRSSHARSSDKSWCDGGALAAFLKPPPSPPLQPLTPAESDAHTSGETATAAASNSARCKAGLQLPRSCGSEVVAALEELGMALRQACHELTAAVDAQLVAFYEHMKSKEMSQLTEMCTSRRMVPVGFEVLTEPTAAPTGATATAAVHRARGRRPFGSAGERRPAADFLCEAVAAAADSDGDVDEKGINAAERQRVSRGSPRLKTTIIVSSGAADLDAALTKLPKLPAPRQTSRAQKNSSRAPSATRDARTGKLGAELAEGRGAAATLQSFLYLLLEAALTQCEATCGAVFINEVCAAATGGAGDKQTTTPSQPRFLRSIARIHTHDYLPDIVSYATINTLTTIVQTGVALNLRSATFRAAGHGGRDGDDVRAAEEGGAVETHHRPAASSRYLNVSNCVAIPLKDFGVVVVANKRSAASAGGDFTAMDEHVVWGVARLCEQLLTRYKRELLLQFAWNPSGIHALRKFSRLAPVHRGSGLASSRGGSLGSGSLRRRQQLAFLSPCPTAAVDGDGGGDDDVGVDGGILHFLSSRQMERPVVATLSIVRTADDRTFKALPAELLPRRAVGGGGGGGRVAGSAAAGEGPATLHEEDVYEGAARYIANLESLWRQSLEQHNRTKLILDRCDREGEARRDLVSALEDKVRRLNAKIRQMERRATAGLLAASACDGATRRTGMTARSSDASARLPSPLSFPTDATQVGIK